MFIFGLIIISWMSYPSAISVTRDELLIHTHPSEALKISKTLMLC